jgi:hypothetical protein
LPHGKWDRPSHPIGHRTRRCMSVSSGGHARAWRRCGAWGLSTIWLAGRYWWGRDARQALTTGSGRGQPWN